MPKMHFFLERMDNLFILYVPLNLFRLNYPLFFVRTVGPLKFEQYVQLYIVKILS